MIWALFGIMALAFSAVVFFYCVWLLCWGSGL
jgi:hypothetical protein